MLRRSLQKIIGINFQKKKLLRIEYVIKIKFLKSKLYCASVILIMGAIWRIIITNLYLNYLGHAQKKSLINFQNLKFLDYVLRNKYLIKWILSTYFLLCVLVILILGFIWRMIVTNFQLYVLAYASKRSPKIFFRLISPKKFSESRM